MLTLINYWNSIWRDQITLAENALHHRNDAEERAFERQLRRQSKWHVHSGSKVRSVVLPQFRG